MWISAQKKIKGLKRLKIVLKSFYEVELWKYEMCIKVKMQQAYCSNFSNVDAGHNNNKKSERLT